MSKPIAAAATSSAPPYTAIAPPPPIAPPYTASTLPLLPIAPIPVFPPPIAPVTVNIPPLAPVPSLPQYHQLLFQRDAQMITPQAIHNVKVALASGETKGEVKKKAIPRKAAGQSWVDPTLAEWPENDFRIFCGNLGNEVSDDVLSKAFSRFSSFNMARVVRDKRSGKTKGYGFVSFSNPSDLAVALKEMNDKYVGNRPIKLRKSTWKDRTDYEALQRQMNEPHRKSKLSKKNVLHK